MNSNKYPIDVRLTSLFIVILFFINCVFFTQPFGTLVASITKLFSVKDYLAGIGTIAASFAGALFAFQFATRQRREKEIDDNVTAGNLALFSLMEIWTFQKQYQRNAVEPFRGRPDVWLNFPLTQPLASRDVSLDAKSLSFLLQSHSQIFQEIILEESRFKSLADIISRRNLLMSTQAIPRLEAARLNIGQQIPDQQMRQILGPSIANQLQILTNSLIEFVDENVVSSFAAFEKLRVALAQRYPTQKFIRVQALN